MARKLKTFVTNLGFFEMALAAPSMKAALEAWGMSNNAFQHGFAKQTDDPKIVAATLAKPGVTLRRPVGTKGAFTEDSSLPKTFWMKGALASAAVPKKSAKSVHKPRKVASPKTPDKTEKGVILSFESARRRRDDGHEKAAAREAALQEREQARIERAVAKAESALVSAEEPHEAVMANIAKEHHKLQRRASMEKERWQKERDKLEEARERATI